MAIDTREKRMAMLGFGDGTNLYTLFEADGAVNADDRAHLLDLYSGFGATGIGAGRLTRGKGRARRTLRAIAFLTLLFV